MISGLRSLKDDREYYIQYIKDHVNFYYYDMGIASRPIPLKYTLYCQKFSNREYKRDDGKILTKDRASYIVDILRQIRSMPDVVCASSCGQYILFHYYYKKEDGQVRFHIDEAGSRVLHYDDDNNMPDDTNPIEPNTIKEVAWHIDDSTYLWDGVPPSDH